MAPPPRPRIHRRLTLPLYLAAWAMLVVTHVVPNPLFGLYELFDHALLGLRFAVGTRLRPVTPVPEVVVIEIDDASLASRTEPWPWSRRTLAALIDRLTQARCRVVGVDLFFASPNGEDPEGDRMLAAAMRRNGRVVLASVVIGTPGDLEIPLPHASFQDAAMGVGVPLQLVDPVGQATRFGVLVRGRQRSMHGFVVEILGAAGGRDAVRAKVYRESQVLVLSRVGGDQSARVEVPLYPDGSLDIDFRYLHAFSRIPAAALLAGQVPEAALRDRIVLVGVTARSLQDRFYTPVHEDVGGVELHATSISALLRGDVVRPPSSLQEFAMVAAIGIAMGLLGLSQRPRSLLTLSLVAGTLWWLVSLWAFARSGLTVPLARPTGLGILLTLGGLLRYRFRTLVEVTAEDVLEGAPSSAFGAARSAAPTRRSIPLPGAHTALSARPAAGDETSGVPTQAGPAAGSTGAEALPGTRAREPGTKARSADTPPPTRAPDTAGSPPSDAPASTRSRSPRRRKNPVEVCHELLDRGDIDGAADAVLSMRLQEHPVDGLFELARRFEDRAALETAERLYESVYAREPNFRDVERRLGELRDKLSRFDEDDVARMLARSVLHPRFHDPELVARGGMGFVFRVTDAERGGAMLALKVLSPFLANVPVIRERFLRESERLAELDHPHLVRVYDVFPANLPYYTMEFLTGRSLQQVLAREGPLTPEQVLQVGVQALEGLEVAHRAGIVHRDLKPDNLMVDEGWNAKVVDFGVAHFDEGDRLTKTGQILGTLRYMSPEQLSGRAVDTRSDLYSMGVVLHELATGALPFGLDPSGLPVGEPNLARLSRVHPELAGALVGCFARDPDERYASAAELGEVLGRLKEA